MISVLNEHAIAFEHNPKFRFVPPPKTLHLPLQRGKVSMHGQGIAVIKSTPAFLR